MRLKQWCAICAATLVGGSAMAQTWSVLPATGQPVAPGTVVSTPVNRGLMTVNGQLPPDAVIVQAPEMKKEAPPEMVPPPAGAVAPAPAVCEEPAAPPAEAPWGPTPLTAVNCANDLINKLCYDGETDCNGKKKECPVKLYGWMDFDYTYNSSGPGIANGAAGGPGLAPVMNRFGDEFLVRQLGLYLTKPLDPKDWSWGFNAILIAGNDAAFLNPTAGWFATTNPRFGVSFTDLNGTAHLPILTEGGIDVKVGRQTTCLGPMGALPWQRYFDSSDYEWFNMEEGRYTGVSANWIISKRLSWYNGIELGGWGVFFDGWNNPSGPDYLGQINYWLDCEAKKTQLTLTVLTGPTGVGGGNTTATEVTIHQNWSKNVYQVISYQSNYSKALFFFGPPPPGYLERAYAVYSYQGVHLNKTVDFNTRLEWYRDVDGNLYPGGFSTPKTNYYEATVGFDYHPVKWLQLRPEVRGDFANNAVFGIGDQKAVRAFHNDQLTVAIEALIKF